MKNKKEGQSAMEFLTTYGWAIILIAVVLGALYYFGVFNASTFQARGPPGDCTVYRFDGPRTLSDINLEGVCDGELPQSVFVAKGIGDYEIVNSSVNTSSGLNISNNITITAWVDVFGQPLHDIVDKEAQYGMKLNYNGYPDGCWPSQAQGFCLEWDTANSWWGTTWPIPNASFNKWMFLAVTSKDGYWEYWYANGQEIGNWTVNQSQPEGVVPPCIVNDTAVPLAIGGDQGIVGNEPWSGCYPGYGGYGGQEAEWFNGSIANVQIYNQSLSASQIYELYKEGLAGAPIDLKYIVGWWPLNGNGNDYSGNKNNAYTYNSYYTGGSYINNYNYQAP